MARSKTIDEATEAVGATARSASVKARRVARAATSEGSRVYKKAQATAARQRSVFDDMFEQADERLDGARKTASEWSQVAVRRARQDPVVATMVLAAGAAIAASLVGWALNRR